MSATAFTADGLWHCLCPSFNRLLVKRIPVVSNSQQSRLRRPRAAVSSAFSSQCRPYSEQRGDTHTSQPRLRSHEDQSGKKFNQWAPTSLGPGHGQAATNRSEPAAKPQRKNTKSAGKKKRESKKELSKDLEERTTSNLENILQDHVEVSPSVGDTGRILQVLLRDRQIRPQVRHYRALILANTDAQRGSPVQVRKLLQEMEQNGVPTDSGTLHAALKVKFLSRKLLGTSVPNNAGLNIDPCNSSRSPLATRNPSHYTRPLADSQPEWLAQCDRWLNQRTTIRTCTRESSWC